MKLEDIKPPVSTITGVGPAASKLFAKLNVFTAADLLSLYPKSYDDRRKRVPLSNFQKGKVNTAALVTGHEWFGFGKMRTLKIIITDGETNAALIAFNRPFLEKALPEGAAIAVNGSFAVKYGQLQSSAFEAVKLADSAALDDLHSFALPDAKILPVYPLTEGLNQKNVRKAVAAALRQYAKGIEDELPEEIIAARKLLHKKDAITLIHVPKTLEEVEAARKTLIYEELFKFQTVMARRAWKHKGALPSVNVLPAACTIFSDSEDETEKINAEFDKNLSPLQKQLCARLPFELTSGQKRVITEMNADIDRGYKERCALLNGVQDAAKAPPFTMARLLQGDVGSGKTLAAFFACLRVINWKGQCALMAPTEILARQHAESAANLLEPLGITTAFLTGNVKAAGRTALLKQLKNGSVNILIGTHALFSQGVVYDDLQIAVIDEQHRFGVVQRQAIIDKGRKSEGENALTFEPHLLMMSATPIPQTLALTAFGDLDVSVIKSMPAGRKPVQTYLVREGNERNAYEAVRKQLAAGRQAYFVYSAIENDTAAGVKSAEEAFARLSQAVFPEYKCALLHSKIDDDAQIGILRDFRAGKIHIIAATTVIEVGVDVPNANCIVIEEADRFGLAQLHQLRGRVGRGNEQSYCFLIYGKNLSESGIERMKVLRQNTDGFIIAEEDLKLRGPGEIAGTAQSGNLTLGIADIARDREILLKAREDAFRVFEKDLQALRQNTK